MGFKLTWATGEIEALPREGSRHKGQIEWSCSLAEFDGCPMTATHLSFFVTEAEEFKLRFPSRTKLPRIGFEVDQIVAN